MSESASNEQFQKAEDEYFRLKGQLAAGRITQSQFETALKDLIVQDAQGRYWMLGVDSAHWYVHDGKKWVEAQPSSELSISIPEASAPNASTQTLSAPQGPSRNLRMLAIGLAGLIFICIGIGVVLFFIVRQDSPFLVLNRAATPTFILQAPLNTPTSILLPTNSPFPAATPTPSLTLIPLPVATVTPSLTSLPSPTATNTLIPSATPKPQGNCADPNAQWENVTDGQRIDPYAAMQGTAFAPDFDEYVVEYIRPGNVLYRSRVPVLHNVLFVWNTYTVGNGEYLLALIVRLKDGTSLAPCVIRVFVAH